MTDLSRDELKAHLSAVEAQVRAALRIVAAESKSVQQAHSSLRADLSAALVRLQSDLNSNSSELDNKLNKVISDVDNLGKQRRLLTSLLVTLVFLFGIAVGVFAGGGWYLAEQGHIDGLFETGALETVLPDETDTGSNGASTSEEIIVGD